MVKFLLKRPIAVTMTFLAIVILGLVSSSQLPVSLMPDIDIPKITVQANYPNHSAAEIEQIIANPLRRQLMQVSHLDNIESESRDEGCIIQMDFEYGADIDLVFIEVNEKIDRATSSLPREISRPSVIKASATDIPVFYLNLTLKNEHVGEQQTNPLFPVSQEFAELSNFSNFVIRKRIEQQQEVAMVDLSGQVFSELLIIPDLEKLEALKLSISAIESAISNNNITLGNLLIKDGQYQYNIRFASALQNKQDIENIYIKIEDRLLQLKDVAEVVLHPSKRQGLVTSNGKDAITMAIIKQSDAQMQLLRDKLDKLIAQFRRDYPHVDFEITRNQTQLLDYTISNLKQSLMLGGLLAFLIMFFFLKDYKSPFLISITIPVSLVISFLLFYLLGVSINIISISGLILGVGMMIDNSIIVIDNITQHIDRSKRATHITYSDLLFAACIKGTNELFRPLLSSVLTTCAVFIPLIFIKGISGALFFDQAMAITIGLLTSLVVSITLLPVYYRLMYKHNTHKQNIFRRINGVDYGTLYERGFRLTMKNQKAVWVIVFLMLLATPLLYKSLEKEKIPEMTKDEILLHVDWNENIHIDENRLRIEQLISTLDTLLLQHTNFIGNQQFLLNHNADLTSSEGIVYLKARSPRSLAILQKTITDYLKHSFPDALFNFSDAGNIFDLMFSDDEPELIAKLRTTRDLGSKTNEKLIRILSEIDALTPQYTISPISWEDNLVLKMSPQKLAVYHISFSSIIRQLKSAFSENELFEISAGTQQMVPVVIGGKTRLVKEVLNNLIVNNSKGEPVPIYSLITEEKEQSLKNITAGREGRYYPISFDVDQKQAQEYITSISRLVRKNTDFEVDFSGSLFATRELMKQLGMILLISLSLLYFILATQFESLTLPLIVLLEVPIDIFGAFLMLWLFGESINLMSLIGIIVMCGIIINDSILKIDTINQLRNQGCSMLHAIAEAGHRRLKPILMTSLTTILALLPFLFISGMGGELQRPLALAVIGGMIIGTIVSLYVVPLLYYWLENSEKKTKNDKPVLGEYLPLTPCKRLSRFFVRKTAQ